MNFVVRFAFPSPTLHIPLNSLFSVVIILIPLLILPLVIRIIHAISKLLYTLDLTIPFILNILRNVLYCLDLLARPLRRVLREILDILDAIVPFLLGVVAKVFDAADLLPGPIRCVLRKVGDVVAEFVEAAFGAGDCVVEALLCDRCQYRNTMEVDIDGGGLPMLSLSCISNAPPASPATPAAAYFKPLPPLLCSSCWYPLPRAGS
jgi:hypothetical protein